MKRLSVVAVVAFALLSAPVDAQAATAEPLSPSDLAVPAAFTATPDGSRLLYGERFTGRIMRLDPATGTSTPFFTVPDVAMAGEQGLLGLALDPSYPADARVWAFVTRTVSGTPRNQLVRISADGSGFSVLRNLPTAMFHNGGRIIFGPDHKLYVVIGERHSAALAQDLSSLAGKVLRLNPDGTVPSNNPSAGSPIIGYGIRNSFGSAFDPKEGRLWLTDNGDDCNDEINLIARRTLRNYGWGPSATCTSPPAAPRNTNQDGQSSVLPKLFLPVSQGITGAAFCHLCGLPPSGGQLFFAEFNTGIIRRARLTSDRLGIASQAPFYDHPQFVLSLETPLNGGPIYFSTTTNIFRLDP
ncbi:MAG TPA: PQQ-dependent sugar dehydrogenase [Solirubrobacterales bacterium]|nr:PQQ-dependent sugar dehydrogenase [Solirubrobacterales bacterium]